MAEEPKKISFGFTKIKKKPVISVQRSEEKEIQFIDCLEGNSIKILNGKEEKELPVIPLRNGNILRDNMIEALKIRKEDKNKTKVDAEKCNGKEEHFKTEEKNKYLTLDELAAKELLEGLKNVEETQEVHTILKADTPEVSEKESTLDDYENMPVSYFGLALLRGMGWSPDKGIGKNAQIVKPINPTLRPKGMGLGADKVIPIPKSEPKEELVMKKGSSLKVLSGLHKGFYGKVEGFDELPGRIIVRLTLQNVVISISENLVEMVSLSEYNKNSKILNLKEYNNFLDKNKVAVSTEIREKTAENNRIPDIGSKNKDQYSSKDGRMYKKHKNSEYYKSKHNMRSNYNSQKEYRKHKYSHDESSSSNSDSDRKIKYKHDISISSGSRYKGSLCESNKIIKIDSSDTDSSIEKNKKPKKHHKKKSRHRSRSKSISASKKRNRHRSRS